MRLRRPKRNGPPTPFETREQQLVLFQVLDVDHRGSIDKADVDALVRRLADYRQLDPASGEFAALKSAHYAWWDEMTRVMDRDRDGSIFPEEFLQFFETIAAGDDERNAKIVTDAIFAIADRDNSATLTLAEFRDLCDGANIDQAAVAEWFSAMDSDHSGTISKGEWDRSLDPRLKTFGVGWRW